MLCFKRFMVLTFTFKSMTYFKLAFVYRMRQTWKFLYGYFIILTILFLLPFTCLMSLTYTCCSISRPFYQSVCLSWPIQYCADYCTLIISHDIRWSSNFFFFLIFTVLWFYISIYILFFYFWLFFFFCLF